MTQASMARSLREIANALESGPWVHQGEQSTHLMFVKIGILEVHLHKGWKCHRQHSWLSLIYVEHSLEGWPLSSLSHLTWPSSAPGFSHFSNQWLQGLSLPAHFSRSPLHRSRTAASPWTCTRTLVSFQHHTASCWPEQDFKSVVLKNLLQDLCGTLLESLSSGQVSTSAIGNLMMKVSTSWRILGVTSPLSRALAISLKLFAIPAWVAMLALGLWN